MAVALKEWTGLPLELGLAAGLTGLSIWSHATIDYIGGPYPGRILVLAVFLATLVYAGWMLWRSPPNRVAVWSPWSPAVVAAVAAGGCVVYWIGIDRLPSWSEEAYWLQLARDAFHWGHFHPIWFKGDFPSSFQFWPITGLLAMGVPPILASRIPILVYMVATGLMIAATTRFFVPRPSMVVGVVFSFASLWMVFIVQIGWSDVGPIPLLIATMTYSLAASVLESSPRNHRRLAVVSAVGFASLYMPMIYALIMVAIFAILPKRIADVEEKLRFAGVFLVLVSSTIGKAIQWPGRALGRHLTIVEQGHEWTGASSGLLTRLEGIVHNLREIITMMAPDGPPIVWGVLLNGWIELSTVAFFVLGLATFWIGLTRLQGVLLILPPLLLIAGVAIADPRPSPWRLTVLLPILFLFASIGAGRIVQLVSSLGRTGPRLATIGAIVGIHMAVFIPPWLTFMGNHYDVNHVGGIAATTASKYAGELASLEIVIQDGIYWHTIQNLTASKIRCRLYATTESLKTEISNRGPDRFLVITVKDGYHPDEFREIALGEIRSLGRDFRWEIVFDPRSPKAEATVFFVDEESSQGRDGQEAR